jgi:hypothetical protein
MTAWRQRGERGVVSVTALLMAHPFLLERFKKQSNNAPFNINAQGVF